MLLGLLVGNVNSGSRHDPAGASSLPACGTVVNETLLANSLDQASVTEGQSITWMLLNLLTALSASDPFRAVSRPSAGRLLLCVHCFVYRAT